MLIAHHVHADGRWQVLRQGHLVRHALPAGLPHGDHAVERRGRAVAQQCHQARQHGGRGLGVGERLVQTPLTDRCFVALTHALNLRLGGSPFGPAGTGKTETVKALGAALGRFTLVFNCDDSFDSAAVGRILLGICQVRGACGLWAAW